MGMITKEMLEKVHFDEEHIEGHIFIQSYKVQLTKAGKEYIVGTLCSGCSMPFKVWGNYAAFDKLRNTDLQGKVVNIVGSFSLYNDVYSILVSDLSVVEGANISDFLETRYNADAYGEGLKNLVKGVLSEKGYALVDRLLFSTDIWETFKVEFAASNHHDNCKSGLLAHTYRVVSFMTVVLNMYGENLVKTQDEKDLYIIGALLHDLGKVAELHLGSYTRKSVVTHQFLGVEYLNKDDIVAQYGEEWYYHLVSILLQHHGEYGMPPKSVSAFIVHLVDNLEAQIQGLLQVVETASATDSIRWDDYYLMQYCPQA